LTDRALADVDAVSLSMARLAPHDLALPAAATAVLTAIASNTVAKAVMAASVGGRRLGVTVGIASGAAVIALIAVRLLTAGWGSDLATPTAV